MTISEIKAANKAAGFHFFDRGSMRFFDSRILPRVYEGPAGIYFVTSEKFDETTPRRYTIRKLDETTGRIDDASEFQFYRTATVARTCGKHFAAYGVAGAK